MEGIVSESTGWWKEDWLVEGKVSESRAQNWKSTPLVHCASVAPEVQDALHYYIHGGRWLTVVQHPLHYYITIALCAAYQN